MIMEAKVAESIMEKEMIPLPQEIANVSFTVKQLPLQKKKLPKKTVMLKM
jgi:hypothetical protein